MKYYAVTEDPNELFHYGRLGMKWGKHIFGDKPKSAGYQRAVKKLKNAIKSSKTSVRVPKSSAKKTVISLKSQTKTPKDALKKTVVGAKTQIKAARNKLADSQQKRQERQEQKFFSAVQRAQKRAEMTESMYNRDIVAAAEKKAQQQAKRENKVAVRQAKYAQKYEKAQNKLYEQNQRNAIRELKKTYKSEKHMDRLMQEAREGRLHYGQLNADQVQRLTNRLAMENQARVLGGREKPKFKTRMKEALQEGIIRGTTQGTAGAMEEIARAKAQTFGKNRKILEKKARQDARIQKERQRIMNQKSKKEMQQERDQELNEFKVYSKERKGKELEKLKLDKADQLYLHNKEREQKYLDTRHEFERQRSVQDKIKNENDEIYERLAASEQKSLSELAKDRLDKDYLKDLKKHGTEQDIKNALAESYKEETKHKLENAYNRHQETVEKIKEWEDRCKEIDDDYEKQVKLYEAKEQANRDSQAQYDSDMKDYKKKYKDWIDGGKKGDEPEMPHLSLTKNTYPIKQPKPPKPKEYVDYETYRRAQEIGLPIPGGSKNNNNNNGGGGKKPKGKK